MFNVPSIRQLKAATLAPITTKASNNKITFTQGISKDMEYIGVKAVNSKTGEIVYYQPVEIMTFWGELHRSSGTTWIIFGVLIAFFICGGLLIYRKYMKP